MKHGRYRDVEITVDVLPAQRGEAYAAREIVAAHATCQVCRKKSGYCYRGDEIRRARAAMRAWRAQRITVRHAHTGLQVCYYLATEIDGMDRMRQIREAIASVRRQVGERRVSASREPSRYSYRSDYYPSERLGCVMINGTPRPVASLPGNWKRMLASASHRPIGPDRHVGIEIECGVQSQTALTDAVIRAGLSTRCSVVSDSSVHVTDCSATELRVICRESELATIVPCVAGLLAECDARVNHTCGLHVHIDCRKRDWRTVYRRLYRAQSWLYSLVSDTRVHPRSGRTNYCKRNKARPDMSDRYHAINACSYNEHRTIEVRLHHGTIESAKILAWIRLLLAIADGPDKRCPRSLYAFAQLYGLSEAQTQYISTRARQFGRAQKLGLQLPEVE